jgi:hypothetical protein
LEKVASIGGVGFLMLDFNGLAAALGVVFFFAFV